jgi:ligand-binding sensor domain-containing protein
MLQFWHFILRATLRCRFDWRWACTCLLLYCTFFNASFARPPASPTSLATNLRWGHLAGTIFQNIGTDRGLPHPIATALHESRDGFLWVGTQGGLSRWDGYRFRTYLPDAKDLHSLPDVWVTAMHTDKAGQMWVATYEGGLARYDPLLDRFERVPIGPGGLSHASVSALADDGDGGLYIGTDGGLDQYTPDTGGMRHWQHNPQEAQSLPDNHIYALLREKNGTLWIGTGKGLVRRSPGQLHFERVPLPIQNQQQAIVRTISLASDGSIWLGTRRHGAFVRAAPAPDQLDPSLSLIHI